MSKLESLEDALLEELKDIYNSENQIAKALPKMAKKAVNPILRAGFEVHLKQTHFQIERLDMIGEILGKKLTGKTCKATVGLVEEGKEIMDEEGSDAVLDCLLIGAARRVEHYEIAAYSTAISIAQTLGMTQIVRLLNETLAEETQTDTKLADLALKNVLPEAKVQSSSK